ncbi:MAG TPA: hypothetical protein VFG86_24310 [Chloroflexota bacterium]|nr:hypothetical protein [Chloroflexota bacterium]
MAGAVPTRTRTSGPSRKANRPIGAWVLIGVPVLLGLLALWQVGSSLFKTEIIARNAVAVSRVSLESDPVGARVDMVLVDRMGADTPISGAVTIKVREPDGAVWQTTRTVSPGDFVTLPSGGLLRGRTGYSVLVPVTDWARAPRRGGAATVTVTVVPADGSEPFTTVADERFP